MREAIVCSASTSWLPMTIGSIVRCGIAAWPPLPVTVMVNSAVAAMIGPGRIANWPTGRPGMLCMPNTFSMPKRSIMPSLTISLPPPPPSSAGWKMTATEPAKLRVSARYLAAPSSMAVWPSWPQACISPGRVEA